ncbi:acetyl-CoA carboxylase biotin carboxyl carrier protein subunit [Phenylobacterium sp.]|uniref:acetyl-CoA carboxylase biotin carboxyl carrier protein subunit n=1 Tax=Phenylobacterium sp. TaxID=1871053 RepID=UPI0035AEB96A
MQIHVRSDMAATVLSIDAAVGDTVADGDTLLVLEAMKMELPTASPSAGVVQAVHVAVGDVISEDQLLVTLER